MGSGLPPIWQQTLSNEYIFLSIQGSGTFGQVVKAQSLKDNQIVAIKYIENAFDNVQLAKRTYREIIILANLSKMKNNYHTAKLLDIIVPARGIFMVMSYVENDLEQLFRNRD